MQCTFISDIILIHKSINNEIKSPYGLAYIYPFFFFFYYYAGMAGCYNITNVWWMRGVPECLFFKTKLILAPSYFLRASVIGPKKKKK